MGLCKCPQRKVTNIFCYEHRVNVCEHCLMHNHPKCVVDTYRNWITDSLFSTKCGLCDHELETAETIRLLCFHIVHWDCLDSWARTLPETTAPAGYTCPICKLNPRVGVKMGLFPPKNQVSPIADALRLRMGEVNWARAGLGLPLLDQEVLPRKASAILNGNPVSHVNENSNGPDFVGVSQSHPGHHESNHSTSNSLHTLKPPASFSQVQNHSTLNQSYSNVNNHSTSSYYTDGVSGTGTIDPSLSTSFAASSRKSSRPDYETPLLIDEDDHKYRRRSPMESLSRWIKNFVDIKGKRGRKRSALYVIVCVITVIVLFMLLFGRNDSNDDTFDPIANPNILVGNGKGIGGMGLGVGQDGET